MSWWKKGPWADRDRVGIQLLWIPPLLAVLAFLFAFLDTLF